MHRLTLDELAAFLRPIFLAAGCSEGVATSLSRNCAMAERDGSKSHGLFRMGGYVRNLTSGFVDGKAVPRVMRPGAAFLHVDAMRGYARPAVDQLADEAAAIAWSAGVCVLAIGNSHHNGPLWLDVETFTDRGLIALTMVNSVKYVVPHGGRRMVYGTNPMGFGVPRAGGRAVVFDQSTATMAHGEVRIAEREGRLLPEGTGVDAEGRPTRDPTAVLNGGALLPFGGHKGSSIAMMIDILAGALTGSNYSYQVDWSAYPGAESAHTGQFFMLIDPQKAGGPPPVFAARIEELIAELADAGQTRLPGDRRTEARRRAAAEGIAIRDEVWDELARLPRI